MIRFEIGKSTRHNLNLPMSCLGSYVMYEMMYKNYVSIITDLICYEKMEVVLHHLLCHDGKYGDLMHNCVFTFIGILIRHVMLVRMRTFDIYVCHDIMRVFSSMVSGDTLVRLAQQS